MPLSSLTCLCSLAVCFFGRWLLTRFRLFTHLPPSLSPTHLSIDRFNGQKVTDHPIELGTPTLSSSQLPLNGMSWHGMPNNHITSASKKSTIACLPFPLLTRCCSMVTELLRTRVNHPPTKTKATYLPTYLFIDLDISCHSCLGVKHTWYLCNYV